MGERALDGDGGVEDELGFEDDEAEPRGKALSGKEKRGERKSGGKRKGGDSEEEESEAQESGAEDGEGQISPVRRSSTGPYLPLLVDLPFSQTDELVSSSVHQLRNRRSDGRTCLTTRTTTTTTRTLNPQVSSSSHYNRAPSCTSVPSQSRVFLPLAHVLSHPSRLFTNPRPVCHALPSFATPPPTVRALLVVEDPRLYLVSSS